MECCKSQRICGTSVIVEVNTPSPAWNNLYDGFWYRKEDGKFMCEINQRQLLINSLSTLALREVLPGTLLLRINETDFIGQVSFDAQAVIIWSNGEVWLRK
ncbi:unnamed protein product [Effrenium voratum]|nr:unnamed protein product [Effrenium voratum]